MRLVRDDDYIDDDETTTAGDTAETTATAPS